MLAGWPGPPLAKSIDITGHISRRTLFVRGYSPRGYQHTRDLVQSPSACSAGPASGRVGQGHTIFPRCQSRGFGPVRISDVTFLASLACLASAGRLPPKLNHKRHNNRTDLFFSPSLPLPAGAGWADRNTLTRARECVCVVWLERELALQGLASHGWHFLTKKGRAEPFSRYARVVTCWGRSWGGGT